jgi:glutamate/tyrosine decarboxylase-like PLP-dependent enzyme
MNMNEETLDPVDWAPLRAVAHTAVDDLLGLTENLRSGPVWKSMPEDVQKFFQQSLPQEGEALEKIYADVMEKIVPYRTGNIHPRFWGWVMGNGSGTAMIGEFIKAGINLNAGGGFQSGAFVERQVIRWCCQMMGYPETASGLFVGGGSMANLVGIAVARNQMAQWNMRQEGLQGENKKLIAYASREVHSSVQKAIELLGMGNENLRLIGTDSFFRINIEELSKAILRDRNNGHIPFCIIGCAGTVNTGAMDDLAALAEICKEEKIWFHVDGAFGALAAIAPELRHLVAGMEQADSIAFDMHKWMYMPYAAGCVLVKNAAAHRHTFSLTPTYLSHAEGGLAGGESWFSEFGIELSRSFEALKVWMNIREHGIKKFGRIIHQNVRQAQYLGKLVEANPDFELLAPVTLNIVCFRYLKNGSNEKQLNEFNHKLLIRLQQSGKAAPSNTIVNGKEGIRVCITNHRSKSEDFDLLLSALRELAEGQVT